MIDQSKNRTGVYIVSIGYRYPHDTKGNLAVHGIKTIYVSDCNSKDAAHGFARRSIEQDENYIHPFAYDITIAVSSLDDILDTHALVARPRTNLLNATVMLSSYGLELTQRDTGAKVQFDDGTFSAITVDGDELPLGGLPNSEPLGAMLALIGDIPDEAMEQYK